MKDNKSNTNSSTSNNNRQNNKNIIDQTINIRITTFITITVVIAMALIYFIRIYTNKHTRVMDEIHDEADFLENIIKHHTNFSKYCINMIHSIISTDPINKEYIANTLKYYNESYEFNMIFGWRKYSWIDHNFFEIVTSEKGIIDMPNKASFMEKIITTNTEHPEKYDNNIQFYLKKSADKDDRLKLIQNIYDKLSKYKGSVVLSFDVKTIVNSLNISKRRPYTNFVILDDKLQVIAQSKPNIEKVVNQDGIISDNINDVIHYVQNNYKNLTQNELSYLDMITGSNYHIRKLDSLPFFIIVNMDNHIIKNIILQSVAQKFVEVSIFAILSSLLMIYIYRRETSLRNKAENETIRANNATKAKTDFLSFTAHEIRSPLGIIMTGSEIMKREMLGNLPEKYMEYAEGINHNANVILSFIDDILDENQILEGKFKITNNTVNIKGIIDESIKHNKTKYMNKKLNIMTEIDNTIPYVVCDQRRILQVFNNLLSNAIKYSYEEIKINIKTRMRHDQLEILIIDQGIGMTEDEIQIALSNYGTVQKNKSYAIESYGLGLPIVKLILDAHDAKLSIKSQEEKGTTVKITFPKYKLIYASQDQ